MDIHSMENFISICENNYNITRTSEKLHISQPALSKMLNMIEDDFKIEIFVKDKGRFVDLTNSGKILLEYFKDIVCMYHKMERRLESEQDKKSNVKIGISPYVLEILLEEKLSELYCTNNYNLQFEEAMGEELLSKFINNEFDILVLLGENSIKNFKYYGERIYSCEYVAVMNKNHVLSQNDKIRWEDLNNMKIAIPPQGNQIYSYVMTLLNNAIILPSSIVTLSSSRLLLSLPLKDDIITILPKIFYDKYMKTNYSDELTYLPFRIPKIWNVDMYILSENRLESSNIFKIFNKIKHLALENGTK